MNRFYDKYTFSFVKLLVRFYFKHKRHLLRDNAYVLDTFAFLNHTQQETRPGPPKEEARFMAEGLLPQTTKTMTYIVNSNPHKIYRFKNEMLYYKPHHMNPNFKRYCHVLRKSTKTSIANDY